jgi:quinolinate synthase
MKKANPQKNFIVAPPKDSTCGCNDCNFMKMITMEKIRRSLKEEQPLVELSEETIKKAKRPIIRMLEISKELGL